MTSDSAWEQELRERLLEIFMEEAAERLSALEAVVDALEGGAPDADADRHLSEALRHAHTLKGGARAVGLPEVERLAHALEALFDRIRSGAPAGTGTGTAVATAVEALRALLAGRPADVDAVVAHLATLAAVAD